MASCEALLNNNEDRLYVSFITDNSIIVIDTQTMEELPNENITNILCPSKMDFDPYDNYLYVVSSQWPTDKLIRIRLSDGQRTEIQLSGQICDFTMDSDGQYIWVVHTTYPIIGEPASLQEALEEHRESGKITKINIAGGSFEIVNTGTTYVLPMAVWYSEYSNMIYVSHHWTIPHNYEWMNPDYWAGIIWVGNADTLEKITFIEGGQPGLWTPPNIGCNWSDDGRYYVSPSSCYKTPFSISILDSATNLVYQNLSFPDPFEQEPIEIKCARKVPGKDILWATSAWGYPRFNEDARYVVVRVNTATSDYNIYEIPNANNFFGYFDVSNDGRTLYLPIPHRGSIIKCHPDNLPPICNLVQVTDFLNPVIFPFPVEFDTPGTYDPNGDALTYEWDFDGDGIFDEPFDDVYGGSPNNPTHVYTDDFDGAVSVRVRDPYDGESIVTAQLTIFDPPPDI